MIESLHRIATMVLRYLYILKGSPARIIELVYWPMIQMILWGFISSFFAANQGVVYYAAGAVLGAVMLWDLLFRSQLGVSLTYMEELWSRNMGHLFVSPLRPWEWWASMVVYSFIRAVIGMIPAVLCAMWFYDYSLFSFGLPLFFFVLNLVMMGWWLGFGITSLLVRTGPGAEGLAWALTFFFAPVCAIYYPVSILPGWLQHVALALPAAHVFEGIRELVNDGVFAGGHMVKAFALNLLYMSLALFMLHRSFQHARRVGSFLQTGE